jgi:hypothetical protein
MQHSASRVAMRRLGIACSVAAIAVAAPAVPTAAGRATSAGTSARNVPDGYTLRVSGTRIDPRHGFLEQWTANVVLELREAERAGRGRLAGAFYWARGGTVRWTISGRDECPWTRTFTFRVEAGNDAEVSFSGRSYSATLAAQVGSVNTTAKEPDETDAGTVCRSVRLTASPFGDWLANGARGKLGAMVSGSATSRGFPGQGRRVAWNLAPRSTEGGVTAVPGGPYTVERGQKVTLDGSRSTSARGRITSYRWTYALGDDCPRDALPASGAGSDDARTSFVALCTVIARLEVRDNRNGSADQSTVIQVRPRRGELWRTVPKLDVETHTTLTVFAPPAVGFGGAFKLTAAELRCADGLDITTFCRGNATAPGARYQLADPVVDRGGPFDRWYYVDVPLIRLEKTAFLNPYMEPDGREAAPEQPNWYRYNEGRGVNVGLQRENTLRHEGFGFGPQFPRSGHMQAIVDGIRANGAHNDPRRYLETRVGPDKGLLQSRTDRCLDTMDKEIFTYSKDPLSKNPWILEKIFVWSPGVFFDSWEEVETPPKEEGPAGAVPVVACVDEP